MLHSFKGIRPQIGENVYIAPGAHVIGKATLGPEVSIWFNTVLRADTDAITVGAGSNLQDNTVVHCDPGLPVVIGTDVTIGHGCIIHSCVIGDGTLIGMGTTILNGAKIGPGCVVGAGSLVTEGKEFPAGSVIMGRPAQVVREVGEKEQAMIRRGAEHYRRNAKLYREEPPSV